jgi:hypothetical protein
MRLSRQAVSAISWVSWVSVGVAGWYSSKKPRRCVSYAAWSSGGGRRRRPLGHGAGR